MAAMLVGVAGEVGSAGARFAPFLILAFGALVLLIGGRWLATEGVLSAPVLRGYGVNLEAKRTGDEPIIWLCAHLDSKSQPLPTLVRSAGIILEGIGYLFTVAFAIVAVAGTTLPRFYWVLSAAVTLVGAIPVVLSIVTWRSPGALDNAAGVVTVIEAARSLESRMRIGVLLTDGEELGLAGARYWSRGRAMTTVLNCDGVDDVGGIVVMFSGRRPLAVLKGVARASQETAIPHEQIRMIPGVLTDSVAFTDAGTRSVTFSRGTWRSLVRVHTRRDNLAHLRGTGIAETAMLMAATARALSANGAS